MGFKEIMDNPVHPRGEKILAEKLTDRQKVCAWLDKIGEHDPACLSEVLEACAKDASARAYYVSLHDSRA